MDLRARIGLRVPVIQAPMAGIATPALAAAVSRAGGLGSLGLGAMTPAQASAAIAGTRTLTGRGFGVNLFCHRPQPRDPARQAAWIKGLRPHFTQFGAEPPEALEDIYPSFIGNAPMTAAILEAAPAMVSFHFGLPDGDQIAALKNRGAMLAATATSIDEGRTIAAAGLDAIIAQGWEAGGHRGIIDPTGPDERLETLALVARLRPLGLPVIAAGGIMDEAGTHAALAAGAAAVQCGTAFLLAPEAATPPAHRAALAAGDTVMTAAISGRPARCCRNLFTAVDDRETPGYPAAYAAGKALNLAALTRGETGYGAHWAGIGCADAVARPAAETLAALAPRGWR